ncbi:hypothetical protein GW17_00054749, partial [Ensete ventricosum]
AEAEAAGDEREMNSEAITDGIQQRSFFPPPFNYCWDSKANHAKGRCLHGRADMVSHRTNAELMLEKGGRFPSPTKKAEAGNKR